MRNSILAGNAGSSPDCSDTISSQGYNLIGDTSGCDFTPTTGDLTNVNAKLGQLIGSPGYHPLLPGSPALNAGNPSGCMGSNGLLLTDQRGLTRFGRCDIGAYEAQSLMSVNPSTVERGEGVTYTIALQNGFATTATLAVTDTLPITLTYLANSLTATSRSYGYANGVITWTQVANAGSVITITFGAMVSPTASLGPLTNSAMVSDASEIITRTATIRVIARSFLPLVLR